MDAGEHPLVEQSAVPVISNAADASKPYVLPALFLRPRAGDNAAPPTPPGNPSPVPALPHGIEAEFGRACPGGGWSRWTSSAGAMSRCGGRSGSCAASSSASVGCATTTMSMRCCSSPPSSPAPPAPSSSPGARPLSLSRTSMCSPACRSSCPRAQAHVGQPPEGCGHD